MQRISTLAVFGLGLAGSFVAHAARVDMEVGAPAVEAPTSGVRIEILPGFEPEEITDSVASTVDAALQCISTNNPLVRPRSVAATDYYFAADQIDGIATDTWSRTAEYECKARPVRRCSFTYIWDESHADLSYATIQCVANESGRSLNYAVTATREVDAPRKATKRTKGTRQTAINFYTDAFPGTNTWASMAEQRDGGEVVRAPQITQFDAISDADDAAEGVLSRGALASSADLIRRTACVAVALEGCDGGKGTGRRIR